MVLVSIIFFVGIGYLEGPREAPDLPLAVTLPGSGCAQWGGPESGQKHVILIFIPNVTCTIVCFDVDIYHLV